MDEICDVCSEPAKGDEIEICTMCGQVVCIYCFNEHGCKIQRQEAKERRDADKLEEYITQWDD